MRLISALAVIAVSLPAMAAMPSPAAATTVIFIPGTYSLAQTNLGHPVDTLDLTITAGVANFVLTGADNATFSVPDMSTPTGLFMGAPDYQVNGTTVTGSWNTTSFPFITFWPTTADGGFTIGSAAGDGGNNLINVFQASPGTGQVFSIVASAIPEPAAWAMLLLGVGLMGAGLRLNARGKETPSAA